MSEESGMIGAVMSARISAAVVAAWVMRDGLMRIDFAILVSVSALCRNSDDFSVTAGADAILFPVAVLSISAEPL